MTVTMTIIILIMVMFITNMNTSTIISSMGFSMGIRGTSSTGLRRPWRRVALTVVVWDRATRAQTSYGSRLYLKVYLESGENPIWYFQPAPRPVYYIP